MDDKMIGGIVIAALAILIGLALWPAFSPNIGQMTQTFTSQNQTMVMPAAGATSELTMCGQKALTSTYFIVTNASTGLTVPSTNYTITQSAGNDGYLTAKITTVQSLSATKNINVSCAYQPKGYLEDGANRSIVSLIAIAFALLILVAAIPNIRDKAMDFIRS